MIADGKRGDIDVSARAYAMGLFAGADTPFGRLDGLRADLVTVNPLMGLDAIAPFASAGLKKLRSTPSSSLPLAIPFRFSY